MNLAGTIHLKRRGLLLLAGLVVVFFLYAAFGGPRRPAERTISLRRLLGVAIRAAESGGEQVVLAKDNLTVASKGLTREGAEERVTTADYLSHCAMLRAIRGAFPTLAVVSEEARARCGDAGAAFGPNSPEFEDDAVPEADVTVWIDPLDATHEYTEKLYEYVTTMVCVAVKGRPVIGVIHKPFLSGDNNTFWAWLGKDNSSNLKLNKVKKHNKTRIIVSRSHSGNVREVLDANFENYELVVAAGAGYKALEVAAENVDAYVHVTVIKKWDICAGNAIISALGGKMTTKDGKNIVYDVSDDVRNENGLVSTLRNHDLFVNKF